jgi:threonine dehydratase
VLVVVTGANIDFRQLGLIAQSEGSATPAERTLRIRIPEEPGSMLALLDACFAGINITDFQFGRQSPEAAWPVFTVGSEDAALLDAFPSRLAAAGYVSEDLTGAVDVAFRAIPLRSDLLHQPAFLRLDFYERPGALHDFLGRVIQERASVCYFNYRQSGERVGRALIGFDFASAAERDAFVQAIPEHGEGYRSCKPVDAATLERLSARPMISRQSAESSR